MIPLLDDFTHIGLACMRLETMPADRFAVVGLNCLLGESVEHTRIASLLFILATLFVLDRLFYRDRDWRRITLWAVHPLVLIPFFWASQITTAMTAFWGAVWAWIFVRWLDEPKKLLPLLLWSFVGATVRFEAFAYGLVFLAAYAVSNRERFWPLKRETVIQLLQGLIPASLAILAGKVALGWIPVATTQAPLEITLTSVAAGAVREDRAYPLLTYPFLQLDSLGRYFEGLLLPWRLSFYGDWYHWWDIHEHLWRGFFRLGWILFPAALFFIFGRTNREARRKVFWSLFFFAGTVAALSSVPRNDWYYPVRAYLGTLCFFVLMTPLLLKRKQVFGFLFVFFGLCSAAHLGLHFSTPENFRAYEMEFTGARHPFLDLDEAKAQKMASKPEEALETLHGLYSRIPVSSARVSNRAGVFWTLGLYQAWLIYDEQGKQEQVSKILGILSHSTFYPAVHACLQSEEIPVEKCLDHERTANFCASLTHSFPKLPTRREYRVNVEELCHFKPLQKE